MALRAVSSVSCTGTPPAFGLAALRFGAKLHTHGMGGFATFGRGSASAGAGM